MARPGREPRPTDPEADALPLELLGPEFCFFLVDNDTPSFTKDYLPCAIKVFTMKYVHVGVYLCQKSIKRDRNRVK